MKASRNIKENLIDPIDFDPVIIQAIFVLITSWKIAVFENEFNHKLFVISKFKAPLRNKPSWNISILFCGSSAENKCINISNKKIILNNFEHVEINIKNYESKDQSNFFIKDI